MTPCDPSDVIAKNFPDSENYTPPIDPSPLYTIYSLEGLFTWIRKTLPERVPTATISYFPE